MSLKQGKFIFFDEHILNYLGLPEDSVVTDVAKTENGIEFTILTEGDTEHENMSIKTANSNNLRRQLVPLNSHPTTPGVVFAIYSEKNSMKGVMVNAHENEAIKMAQDNDYSYVVKEELIYFNKK